MAGLLSTITSSPTLSSHRATLNTTVRVEEAARFIHLRSARRTVKVAPACSPSRPTNATRCHAMLLPMSDAHVPSWSPQQLPSPPAALIAISRGETRTSPFLEQLEVAATSIHPHAPPLVDTASARTVASGYHGDDAATRSSLLFLATSSLPTIQVDDLLSSLTDTWDDIIFSIADWTDELVDSSTLLFSSPPSPSHSSLSPAILLAAIGAGMATSLSPCTLSIVPLTLGFIAATPGAATTSSTGESADTASNSAAGRREGSSSSVMHTAFSSMPSLITTAAVDSTSREESAPVSGATAAVGARSCCCCDGGRSDAESESLAGMPGDSNAAPAASADSSWRADVTTPTSTSHLTSDTLLFVCGTASSRACMGAAAAMAGQMYGDAFGDELWLTLPLIVAAVAVLMGLNLLGLNLNGAMLPPQWQWSLPAASSPSQSLTGSNSSWPAGSSQADNSSPSTPPSSSPPASDGATGSGASLLPRPVQLYLAGMAFAFVAAPCCTPVLASLLAYVASTEDVTAGAGLLTLYTLAGSAPLLAAATATGAMHRLLALRPAARWLSPATGGLLLAGGAYTLADRLLPGHTAVLAHMM